MILTFVSVFLKYYFSITKAHLWIGVFDRAIAVIATLVDVVHDTQGLLLWVHIFFLMYIL